MKILPEIGILAIHFCIHERTRAGLQLSKILTWAHLLTYIAKARMHPYSVVFELLGSFTDIYLQPQRHKKHDNLLMSMELGSARYNIIKCCFKAPLHHILVWSETTRILSWCSTKYVPLLFDIYWPDRVHK